MRNYCTLLDSKYLDRLLALYNSLKKHSSAKFTLYVLCMDDTALTVLQNYCHTENLILVPLNAIESKRLLSIKKLRTNAEYCWTCTPLIIRYVFEEFNVDNCTYIDADIYFFSDPEILFSKKSDTILVEHRLPNTPKFKEIEKNNGIYCVEFNYFNNSINSQNMLNYWSDACLNWCYARSEDGKYGDQKYLEYFERNFDNVNITSNIGAGVAPWNLRDYKLIKYDGDRILLDYQGKKNNLVFYHFSGIKFITKNKVNIGTSCKDKILKNLIYLPYLKELVMYRKMLCSNYKIKFDIKISYSNNILRKIYQRYIHPIRIKCLSDVIDLKKLEKDAEIYESSCNRR